jgi:lysozyme
LENALEQIFIPKLKQYVNVDLTQNQIDAALSFMYNVGVGNFAGSTFLKMINQQHWCSAADALLLWNKAGGKVVPGITVRRQAERSQFLS